MMLSTSTKSPPLAQLISAVVIILLVKKNICILCKFFFSLRRFLLGFSLVVNAGQPQSVKVLFLLFFRLSNHTIITYVCLANRSVTKLYQMRRLSPQFDRFMVAFPIRTIYRNEIMAYLC